VEVVVLHNPQSTRLLFAEDHIQVLNHTSTLGMLLVDL